MIWPQHHGFTQMPLPIIITPKMLADECINDLDVEKLAYD
jgi:hypothetical protein